MAYKKCPSKFSYTQRICKKIIYYHDAVHAHTFTLRGELCQITLLVFHTKVTK